MTPWPARAAIVLFALLSFFQFPGHTWLQQDTQIYVPILEHLRDPGVLAKDMLVGRPHVSFTLYDEFALTARRLTGLEFREILEAAQIVTRALGIWGFYLLATAAGLEFGSALLVTGVLSLGAMIAGPQVLIFEFEPTPRAFAVPLLVLATGLAAHRRRLAAGIAGAAAFLIHPPTVYPFWAVYGVLALRRPRRLQAFAPLLGAAVVLAAAAHWQTGETETQTFFARIDPLMERMQRMRTGYAWISTWWAPLLPHYVLLYALTLAGHLRLRAQITPELRFLQLGMPLVGMLSMPLSWLLLEKLKWVLMPQVQPLRALLFVTLFAILTAAAAGCAAVRRGRYAESGAWFAAAYLAAIDTNLLSAPDWRRIGVAALLAAAAAVAVRMGRIAAAATALAAFFLIPIAGGVVNYPKLHTPALAELSRWARASTPPDAVFLFPQSGKDLSPGIFRAEALRAIYVDWKGGGQVNYLKELGEQWWARWQQVAQPMPPGDYKNLGVDYLVTPRGRSIAGAEQVFVNSQFAVYRL